MKVYTAMFSHETSSFSPIPTARRNFESLHYRRPGPTPNLEVESATSGPNAKWIPLALQHGHTIVPGPTMEATPSGRTRKGDYEALREEILDDLRRAMPVDAILLMLHGSQMAVGYDDCEGDLLSRIRDIVGAKVPIGVELDLHCNISQAMVDNATILMACKEYPHTDFGDRAVDLFRLVEAAARGAINPVMAFERVPMLNLFFTTRQPMRGFVDRVTALEGKDGVLSITLAHGFAFADVPEASASVIVTTDNAPQRGRALARQLAQEFFALRDVAGSHPVSIDEALDQALAAAGGPVVIADGSDNPGGGAPGDSTFILRRMLERGITNAAVALLWDPMAAQIARDAGIGRRIEMRIGGKMGPSSGQPVDVEAEVTAVAENPLQTGLSGRRDDIYSQLGLSAALRINGIDVIVNTKRLQTFSPDCFSELGVDPRSKRILVVKSTQHFYAQFAPLAHSVIYCDAPGAQSKDMKSRIYRNLRRPIWPLDEVELV